MTVSSIIPVNNYKGNGSTTTFDFDFLIENPEELIVTHISKNDVYTKLKYGVDYSINEIGNKNGSHIIFPLEQSSFDILKPTEKISLVLELKVRQENKFENSSFLNLKTLEWSFDYIIRLIQIINRKLENCIRIKEGRDEKPDDLFKTINSLAVETKSYFLQVKEYFHIFKKAVIGQLIWGQIFGNIKNQSDLNDILNSKIYNNLSNISASGLDFIIQSKAIETGTVSNNRSLYENILEYKNSSVKNGTDIIKLENENIEIPYILTKTGAKIVNSSYRPVIEKIYNQNGYAPYYTIDEENENFTLPMGEIYGTLNYKSDIDLANSKPSQNFIEKCTSWTMPDYSAAVSVSSFPYTAADNGFIITRIINGASLSINNVEIAYGYIYSSASVKLEINQMFPVRKNDVVSASYKDGKILNSVFVPLKKGVNND